MVISNSALEVFPTQLQRHFKGMVEKWNHKQWSTFESHWPPAGLWSHLQAVVLYNREDGNRKNLGLKKLTYCQKPMSWEGAVIAMHNSEWWQNSGIILVRLVEWNPSISDRGIDKTWESYNEELERGRDTRWCLKKFGVYKLIGERGRCWIKKLYIFKEDKC